MFYEYHYCYFSHKMKFTNSLVSRLSLHCNADSGELGGAWDEAIFTCFCHVKTTQVSR